MSGAGKELRLQTFGTTLLAFHSDDGRGEVLLVATKLLALVAYLAAAPRRSATREHLTDLLWDNLEVPAGRHALRHARWQIHQKTRGLVSIEGDTSLTLETPIVWDRDDFLAAAHRGDVQTAVELYRGSFFPDFAFPGAAEFERWVDVERIRLQSIFLRCAESLVRQRLSQGRARDAVSLARCIRDTDPMHLAGWRMLLEALVASRDSLTAAIEADALEQLIAQNHLEPEPSIRTILATVRRQAVTSEQPSASSLLAHLEMVGREREFSALIQGWARASHGVPTCIVVTAPAGMGKTRLLREFAARLVSLHARHVFLTASHASRRLDFALVSDVVGRLASLPGARGVSPESARILLVLNAGLAALFPNVDHPRVTRLEPVMARNALRELIEAIAFEKPLAIVVDDLHWSDPMSRQIIAGALDGLESKAVLFVTSQRYALPREDFVTSATTVPLAPLDEEAALMMLACVGRLSEDATSRGFGASLVRYSGGSPLLIIEFLQLALERGLLELVDSAWRVSDGAALGSLLRAGSALTERIARLSPYCCSLLQALTVSGAGLSLSVLSEAVGRDENAVARDLADLEIDGFVTLDRDRWHLAHQEFGDAACHGMSDDDGRSLESAIGRTLARDATGIMQRRVAAAHLRMAGDWSALGTLVLEECRKHRPGRGGPRATAHQLLGSAATREDIDRVLATLPLLARSGIVTPRHKAAVAASLVLAAGALAAALAFRAAPTPPRTFATIAEPQANETLAIWEIEVAPHFDSLRARGGRLLETARRATVMHGTINNVVPVPGREPRWIIERVSPDSGDVDLYLHSADGSEQRLTSTRGDDIHPDPSPDGRYIVYATAHRNRLDHTDLAVLDLSNGSSRVLTEGDARDHLPKWSRLGTQIAFLRRHFDGPRNQLCLTSYDGRAPDCVTLPIHGGDAIRWSDDHQVVVTGPAGVELSLDTRTGKLTRHESVPGYRTTTRDGRWRICVCRRNGQLHSLELERRAADSQYILVERELSRRPLSVFGFRVEEQSRDYLDQFAGLRDTAFAVIGTPFIPASTGITAAGQVIQVADLAYQSSDTAVAAIDDDGVVRPLRKGTTTITLSAGGWRTRSFTLVVSANDTTTIFADDWTNGITPAWRRFGQPSPRTVTIAPGGGAVTNGGDGRHVSGIYLTTPIDPRRGLTVTARWSTPITLTQWQHQVMGLVEDFDLGALGRWDHETGNIWQGGRFSSMPAAASCEMHYPGGEEGTSFAGSLRAAGTQMEVGPERRATLASGAWYEVTLQIFPDGRCGVALNGVPLVVSDPAPLGVKPHLLVLYGNTFETQILVGAIRVSRGVRSDIPWPHARRR